MRETIEGVLHVKRVLNPRARGRVTLDALLADYIQPRYFKQPTAYVTAGELVGKRHEIVVGLRGKVLDTLTVEDDGKSVRMSGVVTWNPSFANTRYRLGTMRRVRIEAAVSSNRQDAE